MYPFHDKVGELMTYWVKRIQLKNGEIVTERELKETENLFEGVAPIVGDIITVACRGRKFDARVIWGNWPEREKNLDVGAVIPLRVEEI